MVKACVGKRSNVEKTIANDDKKSMEGLHPLFKSVASLSGVGKAIVTHENFALTDESCAIFGWFQSKMMGSSAKFEGKSFEDVFVEFKPCQYPRFVTRCMKRSKTYKSLVLKRFKSLLQFFFDQVFGSNRLFEFVEDDIVGMRVFVHSNMLKLLKSSRLNRIPLWCIVDNLIGYLDTGIAAGLVDAGYDSVYSHNGNPTLLYGLLRFLPHHCSSKLVLNGRTQLAELYGYKLRSIGLSPVIPDSTSFAIGEEINVNYHMGSRSSFNFVCNCGSSACISK